MKNFKCYICGSDDYTEVKSILSRPEGETDFKIPEEIYFRKICVCNFCGVYLNKHDLLEKEFYDGEYNNSNEMGNLKKRFSKIINMPYEKSDNKQRVNRIINFIQETNLKISEIEVLDVGSGTGVFSSEMKNSGIKMSCIDPDKNSIKHAREVVMVNEAFHGTLIEYSTLKKFELITFNKVLEHVINPIENLLIAKKLLVKTGFIYIELPFSDWIFEGGLLEFRSEFFIEHYTIHNEKSIYNLAKKTGLSIIESESIVDPSGKHTIYAFLKIS